MFRKSVGAFLVAVVAALVGFSEVVLAQTGPTISSTADIAAEVTGLLNVLVPYWPWVLFGGIVVTAAFGLIRRGVRFLR